MTHQVDGKEKIRLSRWMGDRSDTTQQMDGREKVRYDTADGWARAGKIRHSRWMGEREGEKRHSRRMTEKLKYNTTGR